MKKMTKLFVKNKLLLMLIMISSLLILQVLLQNMITFPRSLVTVKRNKQMIDYKCSDLHLAVTANGIYQRQRLSILIKSVLIFGKNLILHLHLLTDPINRSRIKTFLSTWNLSQVIQHYYEDDGLVRDYNSLIELASYFIRNKEQLKGTRKIIIAESDVYFTADLVVFWTKTFIDKLIVKVEGVPAISKNDIYDGVILVNLNQISDVMYHLKPRCDNALLSVLEDHKSGNGSSIILSAMCNNTKAGKWEQDDTTQVYAVPVISIYDGFPIYIRNTKNAILKHEITIWIEKLNGDLFRENSPACIQRHHIKVNEHSCEKYELEAKLPRRTHTYFIDNMAGRHHDSIPFVTLVTQLMLNRIGNLERLLASWKGPSQVALYLTDEEVVTFKEIYNNSNILQQADATYHVIYKRQVFYPINYMRNVAIRETNTPFHIMIDVDFVIQPTLFDSISSYVKNLQFDEKKVFIIPAFEALQQTYQAAATKQELIKDMKRNLVIPYHQSDGSWTHGHKRTNYDKWKTSQETYEVQSGFCYEPYVVVPTSKFLYDEIFLERMRDKVTYTAKIVLSGYSLNVLPLDYLVHIPHKLSSTFGIIDKMFARCRVTLYERVMRELENNPTALDQSWNII